MEVSPQTYASSGAWPCTCFSPGAVLTVDVAPEGQLVVLKVVLGLLRDADLLPHGVRHLVLHLSCTTREKRAREQTSATSTSARGAFRDRPERSLSAECEAKLPSRNQQISVFG